jgi:hypothetical protein
MATHKLTITYDEATGEVTAVHRCAVAVGPTVVGHARDVELDAGAAAVLKAVLDANRKTVEAETQILAVSHAAAVAGKKQPGVTPLMAGGRLGALGGHEVKKGD